MGNKENNMTFPVKEIKDLQKALQAGGEGTLSINVKEIIEDVKKELGKGYIKGLVDGLQEAIELAQEPTEEKSPYNARITILNRIRARIKELKNE